MKVLVTGGAGYIGSHVCKALAARGHEPVCYDNLSRGHRWAVKWGPFEAGEVGDAARVRAVLDKHRPAAVMHLAAFAYVGESMRFPLRYYRNNVTAAVGLFAAIAGYAPLPVVFSSSCATYGFADIMPIRETQAQRPVSPYGAGKVIVERMLADLARTAGITAVSLRYFNAGGADPEGEIGEAHDPETHLIPLVLAAANGGEPVTVCGGDYATADGTCVRDFVHVCDIADAHVRALDYLLAGGAGCALNLANARGFSVKEVIAAAERVCGRPVAMRIGRRRPGDAAVLIGDAARAHAVLGWRPKRSQLEVQIADAWNWKKSRSR